MTTRPSWGAELEFGNIFDDGYGDVERSFVKGITEDGGLESAFVTCVGDRDFGRTVLCTLGTTWLWVESNSAFLACSRCV